MGDAPRVRERALDGTGLADGDVVARVVDPGAERALIERAADGDEHAFRALYDETVGRVHALLLRLTSNRMLAEDLTQESNLRAWRGLPKFRGDASFQTWIHRIAVRVSIEAHRRRKSRELREVDWPDEAESVGSVRPPSLARISLERAIATLPDGAREVFVLYEIEGFRHAEIAEMIGVATPTVRSQLHRAKTLLRKAIDR